MPARRILLVAAVAALAYANTLANLPVLDDGWAVLDNPVVRTFDVARILRAEYGFAGGSTLAGVYRPVATLTWAVDYAIHGRAPFGFHLGNLLLHAAASALVWLLARRLLSASAPARAEAGALGAGLLFAVHPAHVEAVATIVARADLLAATGALGALLLALGPRTPARLAAAVALLAAAVLSKESAATAPLLFFLTALLLPGAADLPARPGLRSPEARRALGSALGVAALLSTALLPYLLLRPTSFGVPIDARWFGAQPPLVVWSTMTRALAEYLRILLFPAQLMTDFGYAARIPITAAFGLPSALATATWGAVLAGGLLAARRAPLAALAVLWTFAALLPVLNVVPIGALMAERFLYLPSVGLCLAAGQLPAAVTERLGARAGRTAVAVGAVLLSLLAVRTVARNAEWRTPEALWTAELRHAPRDPVVNNNLAAEYVGRGEHRLARERAEAALAVAPGYWRARVNLGLALQGLGDGEGALRELWAAVSLAPRESSPLLHLGRVLAERGMHETALLALEKGERLAPEEPRIVIEEARCLAALGRLAEAREKAARAASLDPRDPEPARLLAAFGRP